ncbi:MAG: hypothetical protein JWO71_3120 [Candidatus Acidoferrum typicum]|nr:hypothetical protein [Candidatus Acidoferrum typicum]
MNRLELQQKRAAVIAKAREIQERGQREARDLTVQESADFEKYLDEADSLKSNIDGTSGKAGDRSKRLADHTKELETRGGRQVPPEQVIGSEAAKARGSELRFTTSDGKEVRGLRPDQSIATYIEHEHELPDGIRKDELSIGRMIRAAVTGDWSKARAEQRSLGGSSDIGGGFLVPFALSENIIDLARNKAVVFNAGAVTVPMETSTLAIAKLTAEAGAVAWKVENQPAPLSDPQFGKVTLSARMLMGTCSASIEVVEDCDIDQVVEHSLAMGIALELDRAALRGDGTAAQPLGIRNQVINGVQLIDLGANGLTLTSTTFFPKWSQACQLILQKNGIPRTTVVAPRTWSEEDLLTNTINDAIEPPDSWNNLQKLVTNQIPINSTKGAATTSSEAYVGDFQQMLVGIRTGLTVEVSRVSGDSSGSAFRSAQVWIRAYMRADVQLARPEHFVLIDGIL